MNQKIKQQDIEQITRLGRLALSPAEQTKAASDVSSVLDHFAQIQSIETGGVPTADDASGLHNVARDDKQCPECLCSTEALLKTVPQMHNGQIKVHAVFS
ncbi:MAG: Asp-tRNA(Asn)/Glu-tRNA(Gln) amidotransferase subunit GatC [Candidatus Andersenbacteria bacterium]